MHSLGTVSIIDSQHCNKTGHFASDSGPKGGRERSQTNFQCKSLNSTFGLSGPYSYEGHSSIPVTDVWVMVL